MYHSDYKCFIIVAIVAQVRNSLSEFFEFKVQNARILFTLFKTFVIKSLFRMPAEWEKQKSTLIGWPYNKNDWPGKFNNIPKIFAKLISKITK